jgi:hypothetical protein
VKPYLVGPRVTKCGVLSTTYSEGFGKMFINDREKMSTKYSNILDYDAYDTRAYGSKSNDKCGVGGSTRPGSYHGLPLSKNWPLFQLNFYGESNIHDGGMDRVILGSARMKQTALSLVSLRGPRSCPDARQNLLTVVKALSATVLAVLATV